MDAFKDTFTPSLSYLTNFVAGFEGFISHPKWDYKQYSYGYGSKAPNATATIKKEDALKLLEQRLTGDYAWIKAAIKHTVSDNVLYALTSFNYNLGEGNTLRIIALINNGTPLPDVGNHMLSYDHAGGVVLDDLKKRRQAEVNLMLS